MSFGYYAFPDRCSNGLNLCSRHSEEFPLVVNCAGSGSFTFPFRTDNVSGREDFYLLYMVDGFLDVTFPHGIETVSAGHAVIFAPRYHYTYAYDAASPMNYLWVHFTGSHAAQYLEEWGFDAFPCLKDTVNDPKIPKLFTELFECFEFETPFSRPKSASVLEWILLQIAESAALSPRERGLDRSLRVIHSSYQNDLKIPELAKLESLSHSRYVTVFRQRMGMSPSAYIINRRMTAACELLENTDISVKQVGALVGYSDPHFFCKIFKRHVGLTPTEYRLKKKGDI